MGDYNGKIQFKLREEFPLCRWGTSREPLEKILSPSPNTMREFMTGAVFEGKDKKKMKNPNFLFGDQRELPEDYLFNGNYKWLRQIQGRYMFLPNLKCSYPLLYL